MKVMHVLSSQIFSGAEKVACEIIKSLETEPGLEFVYCSPRGAYVQESVEAQGIRFRPLDAMNTRELGWVIREEQPDLIHAHDMRAGFVSALCGGRIPLVSHIHNNAYDARGLSAKSVGYILAGIKAKHILWVSQSSYEGYLFHRLFAKKSSVLYNIIDGEAVLRKRDADEAIYNFDMIYVGRLTYQKDPQRLMRLCAKLKEKRPELKVAVVGGGELEGEVKALAEELGLGETVQFLGFRKNPMKMVASSKAMVLTSRWEGTPMCALEAMALGTPVVSTPTDGMYDLIENGVNGYLCGSDEALAEGLLKILEDPDHRMALSQSNLEKFSKINDKERYRQRILELYR